MDYLKIAREYVDNHDGISFTDQSVVIFHGEELQGWSDELRDPQKWVPGCVAINNKGILFEAVGGNDYDGAEKWEAMNTLSFTPKYHILLKNGLWAVKRNVLDNWSMWLGKLMDEGEMIKAEGGLISEFYEGQPMINELGNSAFHSIEMFKDPKVVPFKRDG